jgi:predicted AlkP superfamily phosphohydrolase/phosphomutase
MRTLLDEEPWDVACMVFVSTDRPQHCLLEYVHPGHPAYPEASASPVADRVRGLYRPLDQELASLLERTDDDDLVIFMSDHGRHPAPGRSR